MSKARDARVERPSTLAELRDLAAEAPAPLRARGGGTKPALSRPPEGAAVTVVETGELTGIVEYQPSEYTVTSLAGTPIAELSEALEAEGQYLPFEPLLADAGATVGGTVAAGVSGPGRLRYGGLRDFLLGIAFVDGAGRTIRGGGKVVKNAAGFDLPKLWIGSLGRYGVLTEATFKVFPRPAASATLEVAAAGSQRALAIVSRLLRSPLDLAALDFDSEGALWLRIAGTAQALDRRLESLTVRVSSLGRELFRQAGEPPTRILRAEEDRDLWRSRRELAWAPEEDAVVKVPVSPRDVPALEARLPAAARRYYSAGAQLLLSSWSEPVAELDRLLGELGSSGLVLRGETEKPEIGARGSETFARRVESALDPNGRFVR